MKLFGILILLIMEMASYCQAGGCRHNSTHTTRYHKCGNCHQYRHGRMECSSFQAKQELEKYFSDNLPEHDQCHYSFCGDKESHQTISHCCGHCGYRHNEENCRQRDHFYLVKCPLCRKANLVQKSQKVVKGLEERCLICCDRPVEIFLPNCGHTKICLECLKEMDRPRPLDPDPALLAGAVDDLPLDDLPPDGEEAIIGPPLVEEVGEAEDHAPPVEEVGEVVEDEDYIGEEAKKKFGEKEGPIFCRVPAGMGCLFFVKRQERDAEMKKFFMDSHDWGQYGPHLDDRPKLIAFLDGYTCVDS